MSHEALSNEAIQRRTFISAHSILGVEFECRHCGARYSMPIYKIERPSDRCPNCKEEWFHPNQAGFGFTDSDAVRHLAEFIRKIQASNAGAMVRFEIRMEQNLKLSESEKA